MPSSTKMEMVETVSEMKTFLRKLKVVTKKKKKKKVLKFFQKMFCPLEKNFNDVLGLGLKATVREKNFDLAVGSVMR